MKSYITAFFICIAYITLAQETENSLLWKVSGNGMDKPSYLYGTMHVSKKVAFRLDDVFFKALSEAETVALESDPATWLAHSHEDTSAAPPNNYSYGQNFYDRNFNLNFPEKENVRSVIRFDNRIINGYLYRKQAGADDFEEETYLDMFIYQAGKKKKKPIISLEDIEESRYLTSKAAYNARKKKPDTWIEKRFKDKNRYTLQEDVYRDRNIELLDSIDSAIYTEFYREHMLYKRNENMVHVMDSLMQHKTVFAGVGAAHLPGERGMIQMLKDKGYKVTPLTSQQTDFAQKAKNELENLHVQPVLQNYSTPDGFITIKTFDELREFAYKSQKFYLAPDMTNGAYLTITRINTYDHLPNEDRFSLADIDPLLYEDIPGDIISKETILSPFPGVSIVNKTKKGDYQKYHIYKTPLEIIVIKFGGKNDFVLQYEKEVFDSIQFRTSSNSLKTYTSGYEKYAFLFPENYISDNTESVGNKLLQAKTKDAYYFFKEVISTDFSIIEEDAFEAAYIHENFYKEYDLKEATGKFVNGAYKSYESHAVIDSTKNEKLFLKSVVKDESYYLLGYIGTNEKDVANYFNSFKFTTPKYKPFTTVIDTSLHFSVKTHVKQPKGRTYTSGYGSKSEPYDEQRKSIAYVSKSNEMIFVQRTKFHDLQMYHNVDSLWNEIEKSYTRDLVIENKEHSKADGMYYAMYRLKDSASAKRFRAKHILKKGVLYGLLTLEDSVSEPTEFVKTFYDSFTPLDTLLGKDVFVDKTDIFFEGVRTNDSIVLKAFDIIKFNDSHANKIISVLENHEFSKDREHIKNRFITSLGKLDNENIQPFFERLYIASYDKPKIQSTILQALFSKGDEASQEFALSLLDQDFPLDSRSVNSLFDVKKGELSQKKSLFPELLQYTNIKEYKAPIYKLLTQLSDSNMIKPKVYKRYKNQLLSDAQIEIKRNLSGSNKYRAKTNDPLENFVKLLFPFRKDRKVVDFYEKLLKSNSSDALTAYLALLASKNETAPEALLEKTLYKDKALAAALEKIAAKKKLSLVPDSLRTQEKYARAKIINSISYDDEKDAIALESVKKVSNEDGNISIYFFKMTDKNTYSEQQKLYYIAFKDTDELNTKPYYISNRYGATRIYGNTIEQEMYEKAMELIKYRNRKRINRRYRY